MFPHLRYFAYYIARGVLARDNTSSTSTPDTAIMVNALSGKHEYHVGSLIAKRLATNSNKGDLFGGVYATLLLQFLQGEPSPDDTVFPFALSVYLHHLCLIFLARTDTSFQWPSSMRSRGDTSFTT